MTATYLDDETYERRRRRRIAALIAVGVVLIVTSDVATAIYWATGARSAGDSITTLLFSVAVVVATTWQFTHPPQFMCFPPVTPSGGVSACGHLDTDGRSDTTASDREQPNTDEGEQR